MAKEDMRRCFDACFDAGDGGVMLDDSTQKLYEAGEANIATFLAAHQAQFDTLMDFLEAKQVLREAHITLSTFKEDSL